MFTEMSIPETVAKIAWYGRIFTVERGKMLGVDVSPRPMGPLTAEQQVIVEERENLDAIIIKLIQGGHMSHADTDDDSFFDCFGPSVVEYVDYPLDVQRDITVMAWLARRLATQRISATGARFKRTLREISNPTPEQHAAFIFKDAIKRDIKRLEVAGAMRPLLEDAGVEVANLERDDDGNWFRTDVRRLA